MRTLLLWLVLTAPAFADTVQFRTGPADAAVTIDGVPAVLRPGTNGARVATVAPGTHQLAVSAPGYTSWEGSLEVAGPAVVERKLEAAVSPLTLVTFIPTAPRPKSVEFTPDGRFLLSAPLSGKAPEVFDAVTLKKIADLAVPPAFGRDEGFVEFTFPPGRDEVWVTQMHNSKIHIFRLSDFSYLTTISSGGSYPKVLTPHPDGRVFVSNWVSKSLTVFDADHKIIRTVKLPVTPRGMAVTPDGKLLYVADFDDGTLIVVDCATFQVVKTLFVDAKGVPWGGAKRHLIVDAVRGRLYATDMARGSLFVVDLATDKLIKEIPVGPKPNTAKVSPDGRWIFVSTRGHNNAENYELKGPDFGALVVIDAETLKPAARQFGGNQPTGLAVSPDGKTVVFSDFLDHRLEVYRFEPTP
jgi:YVTN family beta-propeller protein